ncbi:MAG: hypothetical protein QOI12_4107 [Alphaproteobacteria bacterium]|jgi:hypothetical protein|nr:hypothetical protein [Alphaproteobacteria bacterium]
MSRLVRVPKRANADLSIAGLEDMLPSGLGGAEAREPASSPDNYLERIAKYVPGEVLAFFIFINAILEQVSKTGGKSAVMAGLPVTSVAQGALVLAIILVPLFVWYVREEGDAWLINALVSTLLFPFWAYAIGAVAFADYWDGNLAAILLATVTVVSGLISPRARRPKRRERPANVPPRTERPQLDLIEPSPA